MAFPVTVTWVVLGALGLSELKRSDGLAVTATTGVTISWITDTRFQMVFPSNENIGTQWCFTYPNYYSALFTQTEILTQASYEINYQLPYLGRFVYGLVHETVSNQQLLVDLVTITPGSHTVTIEDRISDWGKCYYTIIATPGTYVFEYRKQNYSVARKTVLVEPWTGCYEGQILDECFMPPVIRLDAELTLLSGNYYGYVDGYVGAYQSPNVGVSVTTTGGGFTAKTKTDDAGKYYMSLPVGVYTLKFRKDGYEDVNVTVTIMAGQTEKPYVFMSETYARISGRIRYLSSYDGDGSFSDLCISLVPEGHSVERAIQRVYLEAGATEFVFRDIRRAGRYKIVASLSVENGYVLRGKIPLFELALTEKKRVLLELSAKSGYYQNNITDEEIAIAEVSRSCTNIRTNFPFNGIQSGITLAPSL